MNASSDTPASKGMKLVADYRAARLSQRPVLRGSLHDSHAARRVARLGSQQRAEPDKRLPPAVSLAATVFAAAPVTQEPQSVFASLVSISEAAELIGVVQSISECDQAVEDLDVGDDASSTNAPAVTEQTVLPEAVAERLDQTPAPMPVAGPAYDPPLAEIGFGPGMLIRLSQLGLHTTADLARANAEQLRSELGEISRLVDVEAWIINARQTVLAA